MAATTRYWAPCGCTAAGQSAHALRENLLQVHGRRSLQFHTFDAIAMSLTVLVVIRMILGLGPAAQPQQR